MQGIVELAVPVNNRQYKRRIEKLGKKALKPYVITREKTASRYQGEPIELDTVRK